MKVLKSAILSFSLVSLGLSFSNINPVKSLVKTKPLNQFDVIVIGSGIAGLSAASILSKKGFKVAVCESHYEIGGCAHEFFIDEDGVTSVPSEKLEKDQKVFKFEAGPSLYSGLSPLKSPNPLKSVFQMIEEEPEWITYDTWGAFLPEAPDGYKQSIGAKSFEEVLRRYGGPTSLDEWHKITLALKPLAEGVMGLPSVAIRQDLGSIATLGLRYGGALLKTVKQGILVY